MAHHKDAIKRMRQNENLRMHHRHYRTMMRTAIKKLREIVDSGDVEAARAQLPHTVSVIQRVAQKGIIHPKQAARRVSRLAKAVGGIGSQS